MMINVVTSSTSFPVVERSKKKMMMSRSNFLLLVLLVFVASFAEIHADSVTCFSRRSPCFLKRVNCPAECPSTATSYSGSKVCVLNCHSPICRAECRNKKPNCNGPGAACLDPRFISADGTVFYFHGEKDQHFSLVSDLDLQINARFIGLRPAGRFRDYTWIQALGILFDSHNFSVDATKAESWDDEVDHLKFTYDGLDLDIPEGQTSIWSSAENGIKVERTSSKNSAIITLPEVAEISLNVVPVTKDDDRIHNYQIPSDDCFAHLEVQFRFYGLSTEVEGILGRTYQPDFVNPAKPGVAMPVVGGEANYRTPSLLSSKCKLCVFSPARILNKKDSLVLEYGTLDCTGGSSSGNGIVCRK